MKINVEAGRSVQWPAGGDEQVIGSYDNYPVAQRAVDHLSDAGFPVEHVRIIGSDLRLVEDVTGRLTTGRAALAGAATGAWLGLLVGLLVGLFTVGPAWLGLILGAIVFGAVWGAALGFVAHWATRGRRDFSSRSAIVARRYEVVADSRVAAEATARLDSLR